MAYEIFMWESFYSYRESCLFFSPCTTSDYHSMYFCHTLTIFLTYISLFTVSWFHLDFLMFFTDCFLFFFAKLWFFLSHFSSPFFILFYPLFLAPNYFYYLFLILFYTYFLIYFLFLIFCKSLAKFYFSLSDLIFLCLFTLRVTTFFIFHLKISVNSSVLNLLSFRAYFC